jgi:hypothetical protein
VVGSYTYKYGSIRIMELIIPGFIMKGMEAIRLAYLLSYLILLTRAKGIRSMKHGENNSQLFIYRRANKTIQV